MASRRLAARRRLGRGDRRERDPAPGPVAPARPGRSPRRRPTPPGHRFAARRPGVQPGPGPRADRRADRDQGAGWPARRGHALAAERRDRKARRQAGPDDHLPARRTDVAGVPQLPAVQAVAGARGLRVPRRRLPRVHGLRPGVPPGQPRRVGPRRRPRPHRRRPLGAGTALVGRPPRDLRWVVWRLHGPVRPRRGAGDVRGRGRPVRRLRDRRELPPRRPAGAPGPAQDDGHARRPGPDRALPARLARSTAPSGSRRRC